MVEKRIGALHSELRRPYQSIIYNAFVITVYFHFLDFWMEGDAHFATEKQ